MKLSLTAGLLKKIFKGRSAKKENWQPVRRDYLRSKALEDAVFERGYALAGRLDEPAISKLHDLYASSHHFQREQGGMFYSVYSQDIDYRKKIHRELNRILKPVYDTLFTDYRVVLNSYIIKVSGPESEFSLHQDSTGIDELRYSNLSVWIPLQDTDMRNGCMCVVPFSHRMFSPFRSISFAAPFEKIESVVRRFLQPLELKAGDILLFDNRLVHNSVINRSGKDRVVVMSGIYPAEAPIISVYKDETKPDSLIEIIQQEDDYLITYPNFMHGCRCRPETGTSLRFVKWNTEPVGEKEFLAMCRQFGLQPADIPALLEPAPVQKVLDSPFAA